MMKNCKKHILCFIAGIVVSVTMQSFAAQIFEAYTNTFPVRIDDEIVSIEGYNINGYTYFKLRDIGEHVGFATDFKDGEILINITGDTTDTNLTSDVADDIVPIDTDISILSVIAEGNIWHPWNDVNKHLSNIMLWVEEDAEGYYVQVRRTDRHGEILVDRVESRVFNSKVRVSQTTYEEILLPLDKSFDK